MKELRFLFLLLVFSASSLSAQKQIRGIVVEEDEKGIITPLPGALVYWLGQGEAATTDSFGVFRLEDRRSEFPLVVSLIGFKADTLRLTGTDSVSVVLRQKSTLKTFEVTGKQASSFISSINPIKTEVLTEKELFKAACCNLSESFETNNSVDVATTDAVTGTKQIRMLGLSGIYTQITTENLPGIRGLSASTGLGLLPGTWIESIQISKGVGSVANGYESITGQINVELKKPFGDEEFLLNGYSNQMGRTELNLNKAIVLNSKWATMVMVHGNYMKNEVDRNKDGFMDVPDGDQVNLMNRWMYRSGENLSAQFGFRVLQDNRVSGTNHSNSEIPQEHHYTFEQTVRNADAFAKVGYIFPGQRYKSVGFLANYVNYKQKSQFDSRWFEADQSSASGSLIYQSIIGTTNNKFRTGLNFQYDDMQEYYTGQPFVRKEVSAGGFFEHTLTAGRSTLVSGLRLDNNNLYGWFVTPRLHYKFQATEATTLRLSGGKGRRTANIFAENLSYLVSSREVSVPNVTTKNPYGLPQEQAWNGGAGVTSALKVGGKDASFDADVFYTWFQDQTVIDLDQSPQVFAYYNLKGKSRALSAQADYNQEISRRFDIRLSYKYTFTETEYKSVGKQQRPFVAPHRGLANLAFHSRQDKWLADVTVNYVGRQRLPETDANPEEFRMPDSSPDYALVNLQITRNFKSWSVYLGVENVTNVRQTRQIISPEDPHNGYFDASLIWGPTYGSMVYGGVRWKIGQKG